MNDSADIHQTTEKGPLRLEGRVEPEAGTFPYVCSRIISILLHPFVIPLYAVMIILFGSLELGMISMRLKFFFVAVVAVNALLIPSLFIALLKATGYIGSLSLETRQDRTIPVAVVALCYGICVYMVSDIYFGYMIRKYLIAAFGCASFALVVNFFWKISFHMIAAGAVTGMTAMFAVAGIGHIFTPLLITILLSGCLASARLYLGRHDPWQIAAGYVSGFLICSLALLYF